MFETKKTLIVVYKDELLMNQLKKMVETHDDMDNDVIGTRDDSINIVSWTEKVWLGNKKAGNISGKILFLGDVKGTDKLIPVIDVKFDDSGVKYGWAGNQAVLYVEPKALTNREGYDAFRQTGSGAGGIFRADRRAGRIKKNSKNSKHWSLLLGKAELLPGFS